MQHIRAELLQCESELRFLQCGEGGVDVEWSRVLSFFTSLQGSNFDVNRLPFGDEYKKKIKGILGKIGIEIDRESRMITIQWGWLTKTTISMLYNSGMSFRFTRKTGRVAEPWMDMNRRALVDLMRRLLEEFDAKNGWNFSEWLVETFYDTA
jgi:hypothetical protein